MSDPIPGHDPNDAYEVIPLDPIKKPRDPHGWFACLCNGIVVRIAANRAVLERYATDRTYRQSLVPQKLHDSGKG